MSENWYLVLELEFDPNPCEDLELINKRIDEKAKFWSSKFNDFNKGPQYRKYHQMIPQIREMMANPDERARMISQARTLVYEPIDNVLRKVEKNGELSEDAIEKIAKKQKVDVSLVNKRADALGIVITKSHNADYQKIYDKYYKIKPKYSVVYDSMNQLLEAFNADNFYDFLFDDITENVAKKLPVETLLLKAKERKSRDFYKNDSISSSGSKLCWGCEMAFKDEESKNYYDTYLEHNRIRAVLGEIKEIYDITGEITLEQYEMLRDRLLDALRSEELVQKILISFCKIERIPIPVSSQDVAMMRKIKVCRCGTVNDVTDGRKVCKSCGADLYIICPECGLENDSDVNVCKCGFKFDNYDKSMAFCDLAEKKIDTIEFEEAVKYLNEAEKIWNTNKKIQSLRDRMASLELLVGKTFRQMKECCQKKEYYKARTLCENLKRLFPDYVNVELEDKIEQAIEMAGVFYKKACESSIESERIEYLEKAVDVCTDCTKVNNLLMKEIPFPVKNVKVVVDNDKKLNIISWDPSKSVGKIYYKVVKKLGMIPIDENDGEEVGNVSMCYIADKDVNPGEYYYYAVFARRAGVFSKIAVIDKPVINFFEISNISVENGDGYLQFRWGKIPQDAVIRIFRLNSDNTYTELICDNDLTCIDRGLCNDIQYNYKVCVEYLLKGRKFLTNGICVSGVPTKPPKQIEYLSITPYKDGQYKIEWEDVSDVNVQFYFSDMKPKYKIGEKVLVKELEKDMYKLIVARNSRTDGIFKYEGNDMLYVMACIIKSGVAITGAIAMTGSSEYVDIDNICVFENKIKIDITPPKDVSGFVVLYEYDKFPENLDRIKAKRKYIPLKRYQKDGAILIDECEPNNYYFTIFAEYTINGEKEYSAGTNCLLTLMSKTSVSYSIECSKKLFGPSSIILEFCSDNYRFTMPNVDIVLSVGQEPRNNKAGVIVYSIQEQEVAGKLRIVMPLEKSLDKNTYIKAFLQNDSDLTRYQLNLLTESRIS